MNNEILKVEIEHIKKRLDLIDAKIKLFDRWHFVHSMLLLVVAMASGVELVKFIGIL